MASSFLSPRMTLNLEPKDDLEAWVPLANMCVWPPGPAVGLLVGAQTPRWSPATQNPGHAHFAKGSTACQAGLLPHGPASPRCPGAHHAASRRSYRRWAEPPEGLAPPYQAKNVPASWGPQIRRGGSSPTGDPCAACISPVEHWNQCSETPQNRVTRVKVRQQLTSRPGTGRAGDLLILPPGSLFLRNSWKSA